MVKAVFPGSFDPPTLGHLNVIRRAKNMFDELFVVVAVNQQKAGLFSPDERKQFLSELTAEYPNVSVYLWDSLVVDFARLHGASVLVRGVRSVPDFSYEFELSIVNKTLDSGIDTIFIPTDPEYFVLRSSAIKELASFNRDLSKMVPGNVIKGLMTKVVLRHL